MSILSYNDSVRQQYAEDLRVRDGWYDAYDKYLRLTVGIEDYMQYKMVYDAVYNWKIYGTEEPTKATVLGLPTVGQDTSNPAIPKPQTAGGGINWGPIALLGAGALVLVMILRR